MAVKIIFQGKEDSATEKHELECFQIEDKVLIFIKDSESASDYAEQFIELDKYTAIKFSRELRKQIALIQES